MPEDRTNPQPQDENVERKSENDEIFESDTQRIIRRHLENKDDIITDEDIASVRVGVNPQFDEATAARFEDDYARDQAEEDLIGDTDKLEEEKNSEDDQVTPWDTLEAS